MFGYLNRAALTLVLLTIFTTASLPAATPPSSWTGTLRDDAGNLVTEATIKLHSISSGIDYISHTSPTGSFDFPDIPPGDYTLSIGKDKKSWSLASPVVFNTGTILSSSLRLSSQPPEIQILPAAGDSFPQASGGENL